MALVHAEDLLDVKRLDSCKPGLELTLQRDPKCREITLHRSGQSPEDELARVTVQLPDQMPPDAIADTLIRAFA